MTRFRGYTSPRCEPTANADFEVEQEAEQFPEEPMRDSRMSQFALLESRGIFKRFRALAMD